MMGTTSGAGISYPSVPHEFNPVFRGVRVAQSLVFCVVFCRSLFVIFFILTIVLSVLWLLVTLLVSSNLSGFFFTFKFTYTHSNRISLILTFACVCFITYVIKCMALVFSYIYRNVYEVRTHFGLIILEIL